MSQRARPVTEQSGPGARTAIFLLPASHAQGRFWSACVLAPFTAWWDRKLDLRLGLGRRGGLKMDGSRWVRNSVTCARSVGRVSSACLGSQVLQWG